MSSKSALRAPNGASNGKTSDGEDAVQRAIDAITALIGQRRLVPGEQVRQEDLGARLGLSRGPIREALKALSAQQVVRYERNRGYFVAQFSAEEVEQLYWLRAQAESELLRTAKRPTAAVLRKLRALNSGIGDAPSFERVSELNDTFHFSIFALSPKDAIYREVERWWKLTAGYRVLSLSIAGRDRIVADHDQILAALEAGEIEQLVSISATHRSKSAENLLPLLPPQ